MAEAAGADAAAAAASQASGAEGEAGGADAAASALSWFRSRGWDGWMDGRRKGRGAVWVAKGLRNCGSHTRGIGSAACQIGLASKPMQL